MKHKHNKNKEVVREVSQAGRFGMVGVLNTTIDFTLYNIFTAVFHIMATPAGLISGSIAMINSFVFNQRFTFRAKKVAPRRVAYFFIITGIGVYAIRPTILTFFTKTWLWPSHLAYDVARMVHLPVSANFVSNNLAFAMVICIVWFYNYLMYKKFVFVES